MVYSFVLKNQNTKLIILVGLILAVGIGFHFLLVRQWFAELESYIDSLGRIGPLVVALGYVVTTVLCIPGSAITIGTASLFGFKTGFQSEETRGADSDRTSWYAENDGDHITERHD